MEERKSLYEQLKEDPEHKEKIEYMEYQLTGDALYHIRFYVNQGFHLDRSLIKGCQCALEENMVEIYHLQTELDKYKEKYGELTD